MADRCGNAGAANFDWSRIAEKEVANGKLMIDSPEEEG
jgi:hypothetical protein